MWPFKRRLFTPTGLYVKVTMCDGDIRIAQLYETPTGLQVTGRFGHPPEVGGSLWVYNPDNTVDGEYTKAPKYVNASGPDATWEPA